MISRSVAAPKIDLSQFDNITPTVTFDDLTTSAMKHIVDSDGMTSNITSSNRYNDIIHEFLQTFEYFCITDSNKKHYGIDILAHIVIANSLPELATVLSYDMLVESETFIIDSFRTLISKAVCTDSRRGIYSLDDTIDIYTMLCDKFNDYIIASNPSEQWGIKFEDIFIGTLVMCMSCISYKYNVLNNYASISTPVTSDRLSNVYKNVTIHPDVVCMDSDAITKKFSIGHFRKMYFPGESNMKIDVDRTLFPIFSWSNKRTFTQATVDIKKAIDRLVQYALSDRSEFATKLLSKGKTGHQTRCDEDDLFQRKNHEAGAVIPLATYAQKCRPGEVASIIAIMRMTSVSSGGCIYLKECQDNVLSFYKCDQKSFKNIIANQYSTHRYNTFMTWLMKNYQCSYPAVNTLFTPSKGPIVTMYSSGSAYNYVNMYPGIKYRPVMRRQSSKVDNESVYSYAHRLSKEYGSLIGRFQLEVFGVGRESKLTRHNMHEYPFIEPNDDQVKYLLGYDKLALTGHKMPVMDFKFSADTGTGKTLMSLNIPSVQLGSSYVSMVNNKRSLTSEFNGLFDGKLMLTIDDAKRDKNGTGEFMDIIKSYITSNFITLRKMYQDPKSTSNNVTMRMCSNSLNVIELELNDRRIFPYVMRPHPGGWTKEDIPQHAIKYLYADEYNKLFNNNGSLTGTEVVTLIARLVNGMSDNHSDDISCECHEEFCNYLSFLHADGISYGANRYKTPPPSTGLKEELIKVSSTPYRFIMDLIENSCNDPIDENSMPVITDEKYGFISKIPCYPAQTSVTDIYELYLKDMYANKLGTIPVNMEGSTQHKRINDYYVYLSNNKLFPVQPKTFNEMFNSYISYYGVKYEGVAQQGYPHIIYQNTSTNLVTLISGPRAGNFNLDMVKKLDNNYMFYREAYSNVELQGPIDVRQIPDDTITPDGAIDIVTHMTN